MDSGAIHLIGSRLIEAATCAIEHLQCCVCEHCVHVCVCRATFVVLLLLYEARKAKVSQPDTIRSGHQDVSHCNVSKYKKKNAKNGHIQETNFEFDVSIECQHTSRRVASNLQGITCEPCWAPPGKLRLCRFGGSTRAAWPWSWRAAAPPGSSPAVTRGGGGKSGSGVCFRGGILVRRALCSSYQNKRSSEKVAYLSVLVKLHDYPDWVDLDDPDQAHNVGVVQVFHQAFGQPHRRVLSIQGL